CFGFAAGAVGARLSGRAVDCFASDACVPVAAEGGNPSAPAVSTFPAPSCLPLGQKQRHNTPAATATRAPVANRSRRPRLPNHDRPIAQPSNKEGSPAFPADEPSTSIQVRLAP
ncbi:MAG: hypothetical protein SPK06_03495, partial [Kiritimatiellia bacterium]|nr:hypothetical protein [Kiritimatiellia bacterium]